MSKGFGHLSFGFHLTFGLWNLDFCKSSVKVILEPSEEGGYTAIVPTLPGCISEGDTREETLKNIQ